MERWVLDPEGVANQRTELEITDWIKDVDLGDAAIQAYMADMAVGSTPVDYRIPNRTIQIPLILKDTDDVTFAQIGAWLQQKVARFHAENGWVMREVNGTALYADVVNATFKRGGSWLAAFQDVDVNAVLTLECLPDFYGDEVTLDSVSGTGYAEAVLNEGSAAAAIIGDAAARCRIIVTDTSGHDRRGLLWGVRSRHYDSAATAKLFYEAEALTPLDAASTHGLAGASGGATIEHASLPAASWCPVLLTDLLSGAGLTHTGSYRVQARVWADNATPQLRLVWGVGDVAHPVTNDAVQVPGAAAFYIVDLGQVRLDAPPVGSYNWHGIIQVLSAIDNDRIDIDCLYLQPLDESAGQLTAVQTGNPALGLSQRQGAGTGTDDASVGTSAWSSPSSITAEDSASATASVGVTQTSHYLKATNFGFSIPAGTISGILVEIKRAGTNEIVVDNRVRLIKAGTIQTPDKADTATPWPHPAQAFKSYGGQTDLWGGTWTPTDINNSGFGVALSATTTALLTGPIKNQAVDFVRITVYYSTSGPFTVVADAICYANRQAELRTEGMFRQNSAGTVEGQVAQDTGDLPRLPPSGLEGRPVELFVKPTRGDLDRQADTGLDTFTAQVKYRPCYLFSPT